MSSNRIRLVILFGGRSAEHEVSCVSARHVVAATDTRKYEIELMGITKEGCWVQVAQRSQNPTVEPNELPTDLQAVGTPIDPLVYLTSFASKQPASSAQPQGIDYKTGDGDTVTPNIEETPTIVVMPVLHGPMGEDGTVQGLLELVDVPYVGCGVLASAACMDKVMTKTVLSANGIPHTRFRSIRISTSTDGTSTAHSEAKATTSLDNDQELHSQAVSAVECLGLPLFVKPANMGSSIGISKASTLKEVKKAVSLAANYDRVIILEEAVNAREIEISVMGNQAYLTSIPGEIVPGAEFYTYDDKYEDGAELLIPSPLSVDEIRTVQSLAVSACRALQVEGLARVDFLYEDGRNGRGSRGWFVNELNTMPGFTPISMYPKLWDATGISYTELIDRLIGLAFERYLNKRRHTRIGR
ncbi:MAG: D-alanine--D-alanine ligase [Acidimicrobiaceae bacterium]|nr:D-alanine--D-alanine ligase [Acidimicrobiaceae bacterium]